MKRDSIPCDVVMQRLWAFIDGELDAVSEEQVRQHLELCRQCYPRFDFQRAYFRLMQQIAAEATPGELRRRVFQALLTEAV